MEEKLKVWSEERKREESKKHMLYKLKSLCLEYWNILEKRRENRNKKKKTESNLYMTISETKRV